MSLGLIVVVAGLLVVFGSFVFAVINMVRSNVPSTDRFTRHAYAMVGMATGALAVVIGFLIIIAPHLK